MSLPRPRQREAGDGYDNPELFCGVLVQPEGDGGRGVHFSVLSPRLEEEQTAGLRFGVDNESSRLNLTVLPVWEEKASGAGQRAR